MKERTQEPTDYSPSLWQGLLFGLIAGAAMVFATVAMRLVSDAISITELAADWFTEQMPGVAIDFLLETLSFSAKPLMFVGLLLAQVILGGVLGALYVRIIRRSVTTEFSEWTRAIGFSLLLWQLSMLTMVPAFGGGLFGSGVRGGTSQFIPISLAAFAVYGLSLGFLFAVVARGGLRRDDGSRRDFLQLLGTFALVAGVLGFATKFILSQMGSLSTSGAFRTRGVLSTEVTPNDEFYIVSKNIIDPEVDVAGWSLQVGGLVEEPFALTYDELRAMPTVEEFVTLECISNPIGGDLISNAKWRGVPLRLILEKARLKPGVIDISLRAWDDYSESIPVEMAMRDEVMVAFEMNGEPLPFVHGFPARLIVPGFFGLKHVKWLTKIEPVDDDFQGYWQRRGWADIPYVETFSRFDIPETRATTSDEAMTLGGVAFAGNRGITSVEVSPDGGRTWLPADRISAPLSPYTWVIWTMELMPVRRGRFVLKLRATDGEGAVQTHHKRSTYPAGATGQQEIEVIFADITSPGA